MKWPGRRRRGFLPRGVHPGVDLIITINGQEVVHANSEHLYYIAKFGGGDGELLQLRPEFWIAGGEPLHGTNYPVSVRVMPMLLPDRPGM